MMEALIDKTRLNTYSSYADSVSWLGKIPKHWTLLKAKFLWKEKIELCADNNHQLLSVSQYVGVTINENESRSESLVGYKRVDQDDLVINIMLAWLGGLGLSNLSGAVSPAYAVYKLQKDADPKYLHYLYRTSVYLDEFARRSKGVVPSRWRMYTEDFGQVITLLPPKPEQTAIARFLDRKTAQIDKAIGQKEKLIELLKERRQILIHNAVTRGLNRNVKMKHSGVEWMREIPEHWQTLRLKYVVTILKRIAGSLGYDVLSITQNGIKIKDVESGEGQLSMDYSKYQLVHKGDFAMNHMDLLTGFVDISNYDGVTSPDYRVFNTKSNTCSNEYLLLILQTGYRSKIFYAYGQGVSQLGRWRFPAENFNNFVIPIPPIPEQTAIVSAANSSATKIGIAIESKRKEIEKLKEYKATLIDSAVTGKIKVPDLETMD